MYLAYTYFVKNKITNQFYYGSRCKNIKLNKTPEEDLWITYFTSSKKVKQLIKEYGKDSFEFNIILKGSYLECYNMEQHFIEKYITDNLCLNMYYRKKNKFSTAGFKHSQETKNKIGKAAAGRTQSLETIEKIRNTLTGKVKTSDHIKNAASGRRGKKNKMPAWNKGKTGGTGHANPLKGTSGIIKHTEETKLKIGAANKGRIHTKIVCPHCSKEGGCTSMKRWHFDNCKHKIGK